MTFCYKLRIILIPNSNIHKYKYASLLLQFNNQHNTAFDTMSRLQTM